MDLTSYGFRQDYNPKNRTVKQEDVEYEGKIFWVSTVDLGLDHSFGHGEPLYYETMVFEKKAGGVNFSDLYCDRYSSREDAEKGHQAVVNAIKNKQIDFDGWYVRLKEAT